MDRMIRGIPCKSKLREASIMWRTRILCGILFLVLTACGGDDTHEDQTKGTSPGAGHGGTQSVKADKTSVGISLPCGGMTKDVAAEILGVPAEQVEYSFSDQLNMCSYRVNLIKSVNYAVYAEPNAVTAEAEMAKVVDGLTYLAACEPVAGIGDAAFYCGGDRADRLLARKGAVWIDVQTPSGQQAKKRVAEQVLK